MFVIAAPFNLEWPLVQLTGKAIIQGKETFQSIGVFGSAISLNAASIFFFILLCCGFIKINSGLFAFKKNIWLMVFFVICGISYFNPYNEFSSSFLPFFFYVVQLTLLFKLIDSNFSKKEILRGVFDGLFVLTLLNLFLVALYPIMDQRWATTIFKGQSAFLNSMRREGYPSAVGIFPHPNSLGFFTLTPIVFFLSCYLTNYGNRNKSIIMFISNLLICFFSFSRASYVGILFAVIACLIVCRGSVYRLSKKYLLIGVGGVIVIIFIFIYLTAFENLLLFKDANDMLEVRESHWMLGYEIWRQSMLLGVGINSHVYYMTHHDFNYTGSANSFTVNVAIHNIHMIVLAETGLVGIIAWFSYFVTLFRKLLKPVNPEVFKIACFGIVIGIFINGVFDIGTFLATILTLNCFILYMAISDGKLVDDKDKTSVRSKGN